MHSTMQKFGYPQTSIKDYSHWALVLRPQQVTLGSLVLICREEAQAFSKISSEAFLELPLAIREVEHSLQEAFSYEKLNYLMLMMVDPEVHFHIIPRYSGPKSFSQQQFSDAGWPGPPNLKSPNETNDEINLSIIECIREKLRS